MNMHFIVSLGLLMSISPLCAMEQAVVRELPLQVETRDLIIKNDYVDKIEVTYIVSGVADPIRLLIASKSSERIKNIHNVIDLKVEAYGEVKHLFNFTTSPNYQIQINQKLSSSPTGDVKLTIADLRVFNVDKEDTSSSLVLAYPRDEKSAVWKYCAEMWEKTKEFGAYYGQALISRVASFQISVEAVAKERARLDSEQFEGVALSKAFASVQERITAKSVVLGRHILDVTPNATSKELAEARERLFDKWTRIREIAAQVNQDPVAVVYCDRVLAMVDEAYRNHNKEFAAERFQ